MAAPRTGSLGVATTQGDLYGIDANGDLERLPVGADDQVLVADAAAALGFSWQDPDFVSKVSFQADAVDAIFKQIDLGAGPVLNPSVETHGTHSVLTFLQNLLRGIPWQRYMPTDYSGGDIRVTISYVAKTAGGAGDVLWGAAFERDNSGFDIDVDGFAAVVNFPVSAPGAVAGVIVEATQTFTNAAAGGVLAGEPLRLFVQRDGTNVADDFDQAVQIVRVVVEEV
jgi:hypothetical protein